MGSIEDRRRRAQADRVLAEERAHRIASAAAEALVRSEGVSTARRDEYLFPSGMADPHVRDCIEHLVWHGRAMSQAQARGHLGHLLVQLGDFTLGGGAWPAPTSRPSSTASSSSALAEPQEPDHTYKLIGCVQHDCEECQRRTRRPAEPVGVVTSMVKGGVTWRRWPADMPDGTRLFSEVQP